MPEILDAQSMSIDTDLPLSHGDVQQSVDYRGNSACGRGARYVEKIDAKQRSRKWKPSIHRKSRLLKLLFARDDLEPDDVQVSLTTSIMRLLKVGPSGLRMHLSYIPQRP